MEFILFRKKCTLLVLVTTIAVTSCDENERLTVRDTEEVTEEAIIDHYFQDMDDISRLVVEAAGDETGGERNDVNGRTGDEIMLDEARLACSNVTIIVVPDEASKPAFPLGKIVIDFKEGCTDHYKVTRKGKLLVSYYGKRFLEGSTIVVTGENYSANNIQLEGTRVLANRSGSSESEPSFNIILENGKATFPDGRIITRGADMNVVWQRSANWQNDQLKVEGHAWGTTSYGQSYQVLVKEELIYKRLCSMAVSGMKDYLFGGDKEIVVDYGNGGCDRSVSVTVNGTTRSLDL